MGWTRKSCRLSVRPRRLTLEALEPRTLLSITHIHPHARHGHAAVAPLTTHPSPSASSQSSSSTASSSNNIIGAALTRSTYGVNGSGSTVAVIDTGVNYNNQALGGGEGPGFKVVTGYDFTTGNSDPMATGSQHGTAVAGLIASSDSTNPGVAPGADIAALKVFGSSEQGNFNYVAQALQWVIDHHAQYNITVVNLSMSDGNNYAQNWFAQDGGIGQQITSLIGQLDALNIPVVAATGNSFTGQQGEGFPSIVPNTISVTSTTADGTTLSSDAQRLGASTGGGSGTDIAAPGEGLLAPVQGNQFATVDGTSFAAAEVSGAVVLLQQIYESRFGQLPTVDQVDSWLQEGSDPVNDPVTALAIGRLDIPGAASHIPNAQAQVLIPPPSSSTAPATTTSASSVTATPVTSATSTPTPTAITAPPATNSSETVTTSTATISVSTKSAPPAQSNEPVDPISKLLSAAFRSLSAWGGAPGSNRIWTNVASSPAKLGSSQPSGQIKSLVTAPHHPHTTTVPSANLAQSAFVRSRHHR
jgi:type VI secretion system secreted protein VgrG